MTPKRLQTLEPREEGLLVEREQHEREGRRISGDAANTTAEPPIAGMLIQSEVAAVPVDPTKWLYSVTKHESSHDGFLNDSGAATSACQQSLADSLGGKPSGPGVEFRSATGHQFTTTGNTTICLRTQDCINVAGRTQEDWTSEIHQISWPRVRQRQHDRTSQRWWDGTRRFLLQPNRV